MPEPGFSLFSTLRYDPLLLTAPENAAASVDTPTSAAPPCPFYLLTYHRNRILRAARDFNWPETVTTPLTFQAFRQACEAAVSNSREPLRLRALLSPSGVLTVEPSPTPPIALRTLLPSSLPAPSELPRPSWSVYIDTAPTTPSLYTTHKTTLRDHYLAARARVAIESFMVQEEVMLWNEGREVMEGSLTGLYFWRRIEPVTGKGEDGRWVTPALSSGGNNGTTRRWLLERGMVSEGVVELESVRCGETVLLSNGVRGIWAGVVVERPT